MASITKIEGKKGTSYKITVTEGRDSKGKLIRHYMTWVPERSMTERQIKKALDRVAVEFEQSIELGYQVDSKLTFEEYAQYVLDIKKREGCKHKTLERYQNMLIRINEAIGHIKVADLRPSHLNRFYENLAEDGIAKKDDFAYSKVDFKRILWTKKLSRIKLAAASGLSASTVNSAARGEKVSLTTAKKIAEALNYDIEELFQIEIVEKKLSSKTIVEHHRVIHTILEQACKEMIVTYNAADKASPPSVEQKDVNYYQPEDIRKIMDALSQEHIKWQVACHLFLLSGCRRGEIMGLKWSKVDFENNQITIDSTLLYSQDIGVYEETPKTKKSVRYIKLPDETMELLKEYRRWYNSLRLKNGDRWKGSDYLFVQDDGSPMHPTSITSWMRDFSKRRNLPHMNPHAFRHTMASILISNGQDIVSVSRRLGHSKTSTTTDIYAHIINETDEKASECIADSVLRLTQKNASGE